MLMIGDAVNKILVVVHREHSDPKTLLVSYPFCIAIIELSVSLIKGSDVDTIIG